MTDGAEATELAEPRIDRAIDVRFRGDWGQANMTRICGWLSQELGDRAGQGSRFSIWAGRGGLDQVEALRNNEADIAVLTPAFLSRVALEGSSAFGIRALPELRALGTLGHNDRLLIAADAALPVRSAADLLEIADRLVIATSEDDGVNAIGLVAHKALEVAGAPVPELVARGARMLYWERPFPALHAFQTGLANVVIQEAIMTPSWERVGSQRPVRFLDWGEAVLAGAEGLGLRAKELPAGYLPGQGEVLGALDFSDFAVVCREDLAEDIAHLVTWAMVKTRIAIEVQYRAFPPERTPLTYPVDPAALASTEIPLHPGAARAYAELGAAAPLTEGLIWT